MGVYADWHQRVPVGVVMIEPAFKSLAIGDRQIELELVGAACRRIGPRGVFDVRTAIAKVDLAFPFRLDACGAAEKPRKLGERDWPLVVEVARRMTFMQEFCDRRDFSRRFGRKLFK